MKRPIASSVLILLLGVADASTSIGDTRTGDDKAHRNQGKAENSGCLSAAIAIIWHSWAISVCLCVTEYSGAAFKAADV